MALILNHVNKKIDAPACRSTPRIVGTPTNCLLRTIALNCGCKSFAFSARRKGEPKIGHT
jgi:hypothetical protein